MKELLDKLSGILKGLSKEQRKIIHIALIAFVFLLLFWVLVYYPQAKKFAEVKARIAETETQVQQIMKIAGDRDLASAVTDLKTKLSGLSSQFPSGEEVAINLLTDKAKALRLTVKNISPGAEHDLPESIPGYVIQEVPFTLSLSGEYKAIGEFVSFLKNNSSVLNTIKDIRISGRGENHTAIDCFLSLTVFLAAKKNG